MVSSLSPSHWVLVICLSVLGVSACQKERDPVDTLPEATQEGINRMGCLIDGRAFEPLSAGLFSREPMGADRLSHGDVTLYFYRREYPNGDKHPTLRMRLDLPRVRGLGLYALKQDSRPGVQRDGHASYSSTGPMDKYSTALVREYLTSSTATGQVLVTRFDSVAQIISGTFEFTAQEVNGTGTVRVTEGRFDMQYNR